MKQMKINPLIRQTECVKLETHFYSKVTTRVYAVAEVTHTGALSCLPLSGGPSLQFCCWTEVCTQPLGNCKRNKWQEKICCENVSLVNVNEKLRGAFVENCSR